MSSFESPDVSDTRTWSRVLRRDAAVTLRVRVLIALFVAATALTVLTPTIADPDLWGHLKFGLDALDSGTIARWDPYSYLTANQPWINHEWLFEVLIGVLYRAAGVEALVLLKVVLVIGLVGFVYRDLCRQGVSVLSAGFVVLLTIVLLTAGAAVRPQLFTYVLFSFLIWTLREAERGRHRLLGIVPLIFVPWANFHGGFIVGIAIVVCWCGAHLLLSALRDLSKARSVAPWIVAAMAGSLLATLVNPYGHHLLAFLFQPSTFSRPEITEWLPIHLATPQGVFYTAAAALTIIAVARSREPVTATTLVGFGCLVAPLLAFRHTPLFALAFPLLFGRHIASAANELVSPANRLENRRVHWIAGLACGLLLTLFVAPELKNSGCIRMDRPEFYPVGAVELLRDSGATGNIAVWFDWGEYAIWHLGGQMKVSVDGRRETVYSEAEYQRNMDFTYGVGEWDSLVRDPRTTLALVSTQRPAFNLMKLAPGWDLVYEDKVSALFARAGSRAGDRLQGTPRPSTAVDRVCFPG